MIEKQNKSNTRKNRLVGQFIRKKREQLGLSQRELGQLFSPAVTTQFISNVERGVTPLPPAHIATLAKALKINEADILAVMEREYAARLSSQIGVEMAGAMNGITQVSVAPSDFKFMKTLYDGYRTSDAESKKAFLALCENVLGVPQELAAQNSKDMGGSSSVSMTE
jgi:transcriptional regulator with XRE-family HTH domain